MVRNLAIAVVLAATGLAHGNGRPAATSTINFRQGHEQDIAAGMTFGMVISHDNGVTWRWMCEKAILYGGLYDPDYVYNPTGALFATTFDGSLVMRDGCTFQPTQFAKKFFSTITQGPNGALYMAAADVADNMGNPGDAKVYKSTDNGMTFPVSATAGMVNDWYNSIEVAPSDPTRVYLSGYRLTAGLRSFQIYKSTNAGATFTPVTSTTFTTSENSSIDIVGIKDGAPDTLFVRVSMTTGEPGDAIWRSDNAGGTWTKIFEQLDEIAFVVRKNGDLVAGTRTKGTFVARGPTNATFEAVAGAPHINCLAENAAGELWACTKNYTMTGMPGDGAGIMKTTNLTSWTKVLQFAEIVGPVECAAGTRQHDQCIYECPDTTYNTDPGTCPNVTPASWCVLKNQLMITSSEIECGSVADNTITEPKPPKGCCETGDSGGTTALVISLAVGTVILRTRRRRTR